MKKRITSLERFDYAFPATVRIDLQPQPAPKHHKHEARCQQPKPLKKQRISLKQLIEPYKQPIKQFPNPILNQLRQLISNIINSSDRIASYLDRELHNCALNLYTNDRTKLIEYLNSLVIREIKIDALKTSEDKELLPKPKQAIRYEHGGDYLLDQLNRLRKTVDSEIKKKRSKSAFNDYQAKMEKQLGQVKNKVEELERSFEKSTINKSTEESEITSFLKLYNKLNELNQKELKSTKTNPENSLQYNSHHFQSEGTLPKTETKLKQESKPVSNNNQILSLKLKLEQVQKDKQSLKFKYLELTEQIERLKNNFVYLQLLLFKSEQMLTEYIHEADNTHTFYLLDKEKVNLLLSTLKDTAEYTKNQTKSISSQNLMIKMKHQAQSMVLHISDLRNKSLQLIKQKEELLHVLKEEKANLSREEEQYEELKAKVNRLNDSMGELVQEVDKKDELIEFLKIENENLKEDLKNLEDMNKTIKQNDRIFSDEMIDLEEKLKQYGSSINRKDQSINQLLSELNLKEKQLIHKDQQIREIQMAIKSIKEDYEALVEEKQKIIQQKSQIIVQVQQQKSSLLQEVKDLTNKIQFIEKQSEILEQKIEEVIFDDTQQRISIQNLEEKIILLQRQNMQLYKDIKIMEANHEQYEQNSTLLESQYLNLQKEYKILLEKLQQNKEQIVFYEREMFQLAKMADTAWYEKLIEEKDARIHQLQRIISGQQEKVDQHSKRVYIPRLDSINQKESREMNGSDAFFSATGSVSESRGDGQTMKETLKKQQNQQNGHLKPQDNSTKNEELRKLHLEAQLNKALQNMKEIEALSHNNEIKHLEEMQLNNKQVQQKNQEIEKKKKLIEEKDGEIAYWKGEYEKLKKKFDSQSLFQDDSDYIPFLQQGGLIVERQDDTKSRPELSIHHEFTALVIPSRQASVGDSSMFTNVSHYQINIINEHALTVQSQKAMHKKKKSTGTQPNQPHPITFNHKTEYYPPTEPVGLEAKKPKGKQQLSNIADGYDSDDQRDTISKQTPPEKTYTKSHKKKAFSESDKFEDNLTYVSKAMNLDKLHDKQLEHLRDIQQMEDDHKQQQSKLRQIPDIIMAKSIENQYTDRRQSPKKDFFKNVNREEEMRAELRLSGEKDTQGTPKPAEPNRLSKNKIGNVYIKMGGRNNQVMRIHRSNSCYAVHF